MIRLARSRHKDGNIAGPAPWSRHRARSQPGIIGSPRSSRESESRSDRGEADGGACAALPKDPYGTGESSQLAHIWEHVGERRGGPLLTAGPPVRNG